MQGIITQIQKFSIHDGPGIRTTVFLKGCPLRCIWCHNPETYISATQIQYFANRCTHCGDCTKVCPTGARYFSEPEQAISFDPTRCISCLACEKTCVSGALQICGTPYTPELLCDILLRDKAYYQKSGGGVTFSGGEPLLQHEFVFTCAEKLQEQGIHTAVETALHVPEAVVLEAAKHFSLFMCDIKAMDPSLHRSLTGVSNEKILSNLRLLSSLNVPVLIRIPTAVGLNGTDQNIRETAEFMKETGLTRIELLKLHHLAEYKYASLGLADTYPGIPETTDADLEHFYQIFREILGDSMKIGY